MIHLISFCIYYTNTFPPTPFLNITKSCSHFLSLSIFNFPQRDKENVHVSPIAHVGRSKRKHIDLDVVGVGVICINMYHKLIHCVINWCASALSKRTSYLPIEEFTSSRVVFHRFTPDTFSFLFLLS